MDDTVQRALEIHWPACRTSPVFVVAMTEFRDADRNIGELPQARIDMGMGQN